MKTTKKAFNKINDATTVFCLFNNYIEEHNDGVQIRESLIFQKLKRKMIKLQADMLENNLI
jgi:hypothetical protein